MSNCNRASVLRARQPTQLSRGRTMHANRIIPGDGIPDTAGVPSPRPASRSARRAATLPEPPVRFGEAELAHRAGSGRSEPPLPIAIARLN